MPWADEIRTMGVRANAETPLDAETARGFGAEGIGLSRCGEHGGDPESIRFCQEIGLDYVSCSPYRVPIARLAAAQAALAEKK